jgi:hypothetical protein
MSIEAVVRAISQKFSSFVLQPTTGYYRGKKGNPSR